jgi:DHA3 family tetracycline resistance protein-like MFS transporter
MYRFALVWWVLQRTTSGVALSKLVLAQVIPTLVFMLLSGVIVDRFSRIRIMLASDLMRCALTVVLAVLALGDMLEVWHVYLASFLFGFVDAFFVPAFTAVVPMVTSAENRASANSLTSISAQLATVAGPTIGAVLLQFVAIDLVFMANAIGFLAAAMCLLPIARAPIESLAPPVAPHQHDPDVDEDFTGYSKPVEKGRPLPAGFGSTVTMVGVVGQGWEGLTEDESERKQSKGMLDDLRVGFRVVFAEPRLWIAILVALLFFSAAGSTMLITLPYIVIETMHFEAGALGILQSLGALSMAASSIWLGRQVKLQQRGALFYGGTVVMGASMLLIGIVPTIAVICGVVAVHFIAWGAICLIWLDTVQEFVEHDKLGRVSAIDSLGFGVAVPVFVALNGWAIDHVGPQVVFIVFGVLGILCGGLSLLHPRIRSYN